jgi:hypothetical protein
MPGGRGRQISEFKASLVYKVISRTARAKQRNPVSRKKKKKKKKPGVGGRYRGFSERKLGKGITFEI